jgi:nicotinamide-nucleotide amidase
MKLNIKIVSLLKRKKIKIAFAESCTGGLLSSAITSVNGSSKVFTMGIITYSNQAKISILNVPKKIIQKNGSVSIQCCLSMVNNLSKISKSKISVSVTGIAGPSGGTKKKPVGLVYIGIKNGKEVIVNKYQFKNKGRLYIQRNSVKKALDLIIKIIM